MTAFHAFGGAIGITIGFAACASVPPAALRAPAKPTSSAQAIVTAAVAATTVSTASSSVPTDVSNNRSEWVGDPPTSWTDPRVVAALQKDCAFVPPAPPIENPMDRPANLFECQLSYQQTCAIVICGVGDERLQEVCGGACGTCNVACVARCTECKNGCVDDSCRASCAANCANCHEQCGRTLDRCSTSERAEHRSKCMRHYGNLAANGGAGCWKKCAERQEACEGHSLEGAALERCDARFNTLKTKCMRECSKLAPPERVLACKSECGDDACGGPMCGAYGNERWL
jgi:hypothetical protein